jgi:hypothetical protein
MLNNFSYQTLVTHGTCAFGARNQETHIDIDTQDIITVMYTFILAGQCNGLVGAEAYELQWRALYLLVSVLISIGAALMKSSFQAIHLPSDFSFSQVFFFQIV